MEKVIEKLMGQTEECLREYSKKSEWTPQDVEAAKCAVSMYEKLQNILLNMDDLECPKSEEEWSARGRGMSHMRGRDATTGRFVSSRAPRYYDYNGSLTSYADKPYMPHSEKMMPRHMSYGPDERSMHSISDRMVQKLETLYDETDSDYERNQVREMIEAARNQNR